MPAGNTPVLVGRAGLEPWTLGWLERARNLVKFGGSGGAYEEVEKCLRGAKLYSLLAELRPARFRPGYHPSPPCRKPEFVDESAHVGSA